MMQAFFLCALVAGVFFQVAQAEGTPPAMEPHITLPPVPSTPPVLRPFPGPPPKGY